MKCQLKNRSKMIAAYLAEELSEKEKLSFEAHYFECHDCFRELKLAADAVALIEKDGPRILGASPSPITKFLQAIRNHFAGLINLEWGIGKIATAAALIIILVGLPVIYLQLIQKSPDVESYAANFEESPVFENLMRQTYQSNRFISEVQPENDQNFKDGISFRWTLEEEYAEKAGIIELRILNNKERQLFSYMTMESRIDFDETLEPGLYYWTLFSEEEMIYIGKFYLEKR